MGRETINQSFDLGKIPGSKNWKDSSSLSPHEETGDFSKAVWVTNAVWLQAMFRGLGRAKTVSESNCKSFWKFPGLQTLDTSFNYFSIHCLDITCSWTDFKMSFRGQFPKKRSLQVAWVLSHYTTPSKYRGLWKVGGTRGIQAEVPEHGQRNGLCHRPKGTTLISF